MSQEAYAAKVSGSEAAVVRELAKMVREIAALPIQDARRRIWRDHNSFKGGGRVPICMRIFGCDNETIIPHLQCKDAVLRKAEHKLRSALLQHSLADDFVIEPYIKLEAAEILPEAGPWGVPMKIETSDETGGANHIVAAVAKLADFRRMVKPFHRIDEAKTAAMQARLEEALQGAMPVAVSRMGRWGRGPYASISTDLGYLRGIDNLMFDMMDEPELLHEMLAFMRDGIMSACDEIEAAGHFHLCDHDNQSMPYARELSDPSASPAPVKREQLWFFPSAQELTLVGPEQHEEFMFRYQLPIADKFGLSAYGCCEDLSRKVCFLRRWRNLRRIALAPAADVKRTAEAVGGDYVLSWRPSPAETVCCGFNEDKVRALLRRDAAILKANGCVFDLCLKDVQTIGHDLTRLRRFVAIAREEL